MGWAQLLGGRFRNMLPSDLFMRGSFARQSLPAPGPGYATEATKQKLRDFMRRSAGIQSRLVLYLWGDYLMISCSSVQHCSQGVLLCLIMVPCLLTHLPNMLTHFAVDLSYLCSSIARAMWMMEIKNPSLQGKRSVKWQA